MATCVLCTACSASPGAPPSNGGTTGASGGTTGGGSGGSGAAAGVGGAFDAGELDSSSTCADADVVALTKKPTVWIVVDGTSQPIFDLQGNLVSDPWSIERAALLGPGGIVPTLQSFVRFGLVMLDVGMASAACPPQTVVAAALNNLAPLEAAYVPRPENRSAMGYLTLRLAAEQVAATRAQITSDSELGPQAVVFSRHTEDHGVCNEHVPPGYGPPWTLTGDEVRTISRQLMSDAVSEMVGDGARFYVFGTSPDQPSTQEILASLGNPSRAPYAVTDAVSLVSSLREVIAEVISCEIGLNGRVTEGHECSGQVVIDGEPVACGATDGWRLQDPQTLLLTGDACLRFKANPGASLHADFPCQYFQIPD